MMLFHRIVRALAAGLLVLGLGSCHSLPDHQQALSAAPGEGEVVIRDGRGVLGPLAAEAAVQAAVGPETDRAWLHRLMLAEAAATGATLTTGNKLELLMDGPEMFRALFNDLRSARHHIHIETFIFGDDEIGQAMANLLMAKVREGVEVRVIYDSFGSRAAAPAFYERMMAAGVEVYEWRPFNMVTMIPWWHSHLRHHRKIFVVDGRVAHTGGMNITRAYRQGSMSPPREPTLTNRWRDTQVRVRGPAVGDIQRLFVELWCELTAATVEGFGGESYFPELANHGDSLVRVVASTGGTRDYEVYLAHVLPMAMARERIWITQGYFAPNNGFLDLLVARARDGVDVQLLLPGFTDVWITFHASQGTYMPLLRGGVQLHERQDALLHAKTAVVDEVWSSIGSTNLDWRSFAHNNELNLFVIDRAFAQDLSVMFEFDRSVMEPLDATAWEERPVKHRLMEFFGALVRYWL